MNLQKFFQGIFIIFFFTYKVAFGVVASPYSFIITQPDGSSFKAYKRGDEWCNWIETEHGYPVILNKKTKFWEYAILNKEGELVASGHIVRKDTPPPVNIKKISAKQLKKYHHKAPIYKKRYYHSVPILGERKVLIILTEFSDRGLLTNEEDWYKRFFSATDSVNAYFKEVSYNKCWFMPAEESYNIYNDGIIKVNVGYPHPNIQDLNQKIEEAGKLTIDAILAADLYIDFAKFDTNYDHKITTNELHIVIIAAGYEAAYSHDLPAVWAHKACINYLAAPEVDGKKVAAFPGGYIQFGELHKDHQATIGVIIHELAHDLGTSDRAIGLPDLYDTDGSSAGIGRWCAMAFGCWNKTKYAGDTPAHFSAWCKYYLGWVQVEEIGYPVVEIPLPQVETAENGIKQFLNNPNGAEMGGIGEYFLIENRQRVGYDKALPGDGLLIWHIDEIRQNNDDETHRLVDLEEADGVETEGDPGDPYPGTFHNTAFDDETTPSSRLYNGQPSYVSIINISASGATMTADVSTTFPPFAIPTALYIISQSSQTAVVGSKLAPFVVRLMSGTNTIYNHLITWKVKEAPANDYKLSPVNIYTDRYGRAYTELTLGSIAGTYTIIAEASSTSYIYTATFTAIAHYVGPADKLAKSILIWPNPCFKDEITLGGHPTDETYNLPKNARIKIYNISGELVIEKIVSAPEGKYELNISRLAAGVYILLVINLDDETQKPVLGKFVIIK